jgi:hypothetical protein
LEELVHQLEHEAEHRPPPAGTWTNVAVALVVVALGAAALVGSVGLGAGDRREPGRRHLAAAGQHRDGRARGGPWWRSPGVARRRALRPHQLLVLVGLATMVAFVVLLPVIGFEIPAALLCFVWLRFLGRESWRLSRS